MLIIEIENKEIKDKIKKAYGLNDFEIWLSDYIDRLEDDYYDSMSKELDEEIVLLKYNKLQSAKRIRDSYYQFKK